MRVANELGAGNGKGAKFATAVSVLTSIVIGLIFWLLIMFFHNQIATIFSTSKAVLQAVNKLSLLLAFTILLNSIQPVLSGYFYYFLLNSKHIHSFSLILMFHITSLIYNEFLVLKQEWLLDQDGNHM